MHTGAQPCDVRCERCAWGAFPTAIAVLTAAAAALQANQQKLRLETKQRAARKAAESGEAMRPRWFKPLGTTMGEGIAYVSAQAHRHLPLPNPRHITLQTCATSCTQWSQQMR